MQQKISGCMKGKAERRVYVGKRNRFREEV